MASELEHVRKLLGKKVVVTLSEDTGKDGLIVTRGRLLGFGDGGDFEIDEGDGFIHYCWPMLDIREQTPEERMAAAKEHSKAIHPSTGIYGTEEDDESNR